MPVKKIQTKLHVILRTEFCEQPLAKKQRVLQSKPKNNKPKRNGNTADMCRTKCDICSLQTSQKYTGSWIWHFNISVNMLKELYSEKSIINSKVLQWEFQRHIKFNGIKLNPIYSICVCDNSNCSCINFCYIYIFTAAFTSDSTP
jgi:hypothetical protein